MMGRSRQQRRNIFPFILTLVLTVHSLLLLLGPKISQQDPEEKIATPLQVRLQDSKSEKKRQIVQSEDPEHELPATDKTYLSDKDRSFERETKARKIDSFEQSALGDAKVTSEGKQATAKKTKPKKDLKLSDLSPEAHSPDPFQKAAKEYAQSRKGKKSGDPASRGISSTNDYLEEVPLGDLTQLNTAEYKFYGFYHRIRQKLEQFWGRSIQETAQSMVANGRSIASGEDHITSLRVTLDARGEVIEVEVLGPSGVKELDDAAIRSFNEAGPFPNPPAEMVSNGKVTLEWGFVVKS